MHRNTLLAILATLATALLAAHIAVKHAEERLRLELAILEAETELARARATVISLDLTPVAMEVCKRLFVRYTQGGHVDEYRCRLEGSYVVLYGPNWKKATGPAAPVEALGREVLQ